MMQVGGERGVLVFDCKQINDGFPEQREKYKVMVTYAILPLLIQKAQDEGFRSCTVGGPFALYRKDIGRDGRETWPQIDTIDIIGLNRREDASIHFTFSRAGDHFMSENVFLRTLAAASV